jgi:hypothetical protein
VPRDLTHEAAVISALDRARRRAMIRHAFLAIAITALGAATVALLVPTSPRTTATLTAVAAVVMVGWIRSRRNVRTPKALAAALESRHPKLQNVVVTAEELLRHPGRAPGWVRARVLADAAAALRDVDPGSVWPVGRVAAAALIALPVAALSFALAPLRVGRVAESVNRPAGEPAPSRGALAIELTPPSYAHRPIVRFQNPERVEALEGTVARVSVTNVRDARIRLGARTLPLIQGEAAATAIETLTESGYFAIDTADGAMSRLITVTVVPDRAPVVRVERPARDLLLPDSRSSVEVAAGVTDDIGISALSMHYTRVAGAGEQIEFVDGELPLQIARRNDQHWQSRGVIALPALKLEPGDSLVYRLVARDARPGAAGSAASDTYFIEIAGPGQVPLEGVEMPPEQERYALSQQMIVLKIRRLRDREQSLAPEALTEETAAIAAEQRSVRANFVFLMGGEVEDEEAEAEQSNEIQEGRLENSSRRDLSRAVAHMTAAEQGLTARDTAAALRAASLAVESLQRAFGRSRYLLRSLASRTKLDPARRLTGVRDDVARGERTLAPATTDPDAQRARELLVQFLRLMTSPGSDAKQRLARLSELGEAVLAVKPADRNWQEASAAVIRLRDQLGASADVERREHVGDVVRRLTTLGRRSTPTVTTPHGDLQRVEGAMTPGGRGR